MTSQPSIRYLISSDSNFPLLRSTVKNKTVHKYIRTVLHVVEIEKVTMPQDREYLITLAANVASHEADIKILQLCHQKNWRYRSLVNGKTLENQLFE